MQKSVSPEGPRPNSFIIISRRHYKAEILPMRQKKKQPAICMNRSEVLMAMKQPSELMSDSNV